MFRILLVSIWFLCGSIIYQQTIPRGVFGVRVSFQGNSEIVSFVCFINNGRTLTHKRILSETEFIKYASGHWPNIYNPQRIDYFAERNLKCGVIADTYSLKESTYCIPFDSLWKIRFSTYPFRSSSEMGWSSKLFRPSDKQLKYLFINYGIRNIDADYFIDTNFWKILSDVQDTTWIKNYQSLK